MAAVPQSRVSNQLGRTHGVALVLLTLGMTAFIAGAAALLFVVTYGQLNPDFDVITWLAASAVAVMSGLIVAAAGAAIESRRRGA